MVSIMSSISFCIDGCFSSARSTSLARVRRTGWPMRATLRRDMLSDYLLRLKARASRADTPSMKLLRMALVALLATGSAACVDQIKDLFDGGSPTSPSDPGAIRSYLGNWSGPADAKPAAQSCAGQQWKITSQSGSQFSGEFSAECGDGVK